MLARDLDGDPAEVRVVHAPGRVNLIGEHTDYNEGFVLPAAIDLGITIGFVPTDDRRVRLALDDGSVGELDLTDLGERRGEWIDYIAGTAWAMTEAGLPVHGFRGRLVSDLPPGAGLSSSAALELAAAWALSAAEAPTAVPLAIARIAQRAENAYVGVQSGLMDQFASASGVAGHALLLDCRSLEHRAVALPAGIALVICHSGMPRGLAGSAYNDRRAECDRAVDGLRALDPTLRSLRDAFAASHASLRDDYEVSSEALDALVELASGVPGVIGARLTGAGFGGCTVNLVHEDAVERLRSAILAEYPGRTGRTPMVMEVRAADGARRVG